MPILTAEGICTQLDCHNKAEAIARNPERDNILACKDFSLCYAPFEMPNWHSRTASRYSAVKVFTSFPGSTRLHAHRSLGPCARHGAGCTPTAA
jgi:hypothetical protein